MRARTSRNRLHSMQHETLLQCITALLIVGSLPASAGSLGVSPLRLTLSNAHGIASVTVENNGREEALVQAETFAWSQTTGEHKLSPTQDVVAVPPIFRLAPGAQQRIRVGLTRTFTDTKEQAFRLTITEVPTIVTPGTIAVAVRHSLPIFVQPPSTISSNLRVKLIPSGGLEITNNGSQHLRIHRWRWLDGSGAILAEDTGPGYLLAGASQILMVAGQRITVPSVFEGDSDAVTLKTAVGE